MTEREGRRFRASIGSQDASEWRGKLQFLNPAALRSTILWTI